MRNGIHFHFAFRVPGWFNSMMKIVDAYLAALTRRKFKVKLVWMHPSVFLSRPGTRIALALAIAAGWGVLRADATTYFVATNGSDSNLGTSLSSPFQTIQHAAGIMVAGDTCFIRGGTYRETLAPSNSGASNALITFAAYSNEVVTLNGADLVTNWTFVSNGIYLASVGWDLGEGCNQVFVDGAMMHEARYPDYGNGDVMHPATVSVVVNSTNTALITSTAWSGKPDNYWVGAWFLGGVGYNWSWQSARVIASTNNTVTVDAATETPGWWFTGSGNGFLWGASNLLDADDEWYLQTNSGNNTLYLRIAGGGNPSTHSVEMKRRNWCVDLDGRNYIVVSNLDFWAGAVRIKGDDNLLADCQAQYLSHFMIVNRGYFENGGVEQGDGVEINGNNNVVRGCTIGNTAGSGIYSSGSNNLITRNLIYNTDYSGTYACCIALHGIGEIVTFNTAHTTGRDVLRPEGTGSVIRFNDLSAPGMLCHDLGVIYAWDVNGQTTGGTDTRIANNWIHDNTNSSLSPLVYLDNYDANFVVDHNVCWNSSGDSGIRINGPALGHLIYNNTLFNCTDVGTRTYNSWPNGNPNPVFWTNNIYQYSASNNLFLGTSPQSQLVNWTNEDFQLQSNAPAINAGVIIPGFTDGYAGSAPDLGAYEFGNPPWSAGVNSRPTLVVAGSDKDNLMLTASPDAVYYRLYATTNLASPQWTLVTNTPLESTNQWSVTLPVAARTTCFYRLQGQ